MLATQQQALQVLRALALTKGEAMNRDRLFEKIPLEGDLSEAHVQPLIDFFCNAKGCEKFCKEATLLQKWMKGLVP